MDITTLQSQITSQEALVATDTTTLANDQAVLDNLNSELTVASQVNALEALDEAQIASFNALLAGDPDNKLNISIVVGTPSTAGATVDAPPVAEDEAPAQEQA
ncbi:MAG TPA: hypothetical protein VK890_10280 [Bacteroidia bacterium]|jgi:hypothetical protein|nr:hypothetical protein [Bacteroidia bacterium]